MPKVVAHNWEGPHEGPAVGMDPVISVSNMVIDSTSNCDPFEILYGLNPLTPIYLLTMPNISVLKHKYTQAKVDYVR